uniref:Uncharacterized protein n=1 Tax=Tanacetum cinerariifolium TaxID=118510 RepID=A0A699JG13_TANCI|nr:hypothetical protein [Tanacetum cinerariifolium]
MLEEIVEVESSVVVMKPFKKPGLKINRMSQLLLEGPSLNADVEVPTYGFEEAANEEYDGNLEGLIQMDVEEGYDLDDFDMDIDRDSDIETSSKRKKALRTLRREHEKNISQ